MTNESFDGRMEASTERVVAIYRFIVGLECTQGTTCKRTLLL